MNIGDIVIIAIFGAIGFGAVSWIISRASSTSQNSANRDTEDHAENRPNSSARNRSDNAREWYEVLEIDKNANFESISKAYYERMKKYHPDHVEHLGEEFREIAELKSKEINVAFERARQVVAGRAHRDL